MTISARLQAILDVFDRYEDRIPMDVLRGQLSGVDLTREDFGDFVKFGEDCYQRNLFRATPAYHAYCLCWGGGQHSPIHDHAGSACGLKVIEGTGRETIFQPEGEGLRGSEPGVRPQGTVCVSHDSDTHRFGNDSDDPGQPLITIHIYSPPLENMHTFDDAIVVDEPATV